MLPDSERLRRASVFQRAYSGRKSVPSQFFILYVLPRRSNPQMEKDLKSAVGARMVRQSCELPSSQSPNLEQNKPKYPLVGFVVSKKALKNACERNHAKRRVREAYKRLCSIGRKQADESTDVIISLQQWYALVWVINEKALNANWEEICKKMSECLSLADRKYGWPGSMRK